ncbi:MAG: hypothetical protein WCI30_07310 [Clostridia bacterium]
MTENEFTIRAKVLGFSNESIADIIEIHRDAEKDGISLDWEDDLGIFPQDDLPVFMEE